MENKMIDGEEQIRFLRLKLAETSDPTEKEYIIKQLQLLEADESIKDQTLLVE
jgi:hypothetical protein